MVFVQPELQVVPSAKSDPIGYSRYFLTREIREFGNRIQVQVTDLTDPVIELLMQHDCGSFGEEILSLNEAIRSLSAVSEGDIFVALRAALERRGNPLREVKGGAVES